MYMYTLCGVLFFLSLKNSIWKMFLSLLASPSLLPFLFPKPIFGVVDASVVNFRRTKTRDGKDAKPYIFLSSSPWLLLMKTHHHLSQLSFLVVSDELIPSFLSPSLSHTHTHTNIYLSWCTKNEWRSISFYAL